MNREPLFAEVTQRLIDLIIREYPPGSKIPIEPELSEIFNVSRTTIRSAVTALCSRNILEIRRGDGTYVTRRPGLSPDALGIQFLDAQLIHRDLQEVSDLIQPFATAIGAKRITDEDIAYLQMSLDALESGMEEYRQGKMDYAQLRRLDSSFHSSVMKTSHNQILDRLDAVFKEFSFSNEPVNILIIENSLEMHPKIFRAMVANDSQGASAAMEEHLRALNKIFNSEDE